MQLGTRWAVGADAPAKLPEVLVAAVREVEAELIAEGVDASSWRWTLTWLEGRPIAELDDGTRLALDHSGTVLREDPQD